MHTCTGPSRRSRLRTPTKEGQPSVWIGPQKETRSYHGGPQRTIPSAQKSQPTFLPHKKYLRVLGLSALLVKVEQQFYWVMISLWISFLPQIELVRDQNLEIGGGREETRVFRWWITWVIKSIMGSTMVQKLIKSNPVLSLPFLPVILRVATFWVAWWRHCLKSLGEGSSVVGG